MTEDKGTNEETVGSRISERLTAMAHELGFYAAVYDMDASDGPHEAVNSLKANLRYRGLDGNLGEIDSSLVALLDSHDAAVDAEHRARESTLSKASAVVRYLRAKYMGETDD